MAIDYVSTSYPDNVNDAADNTLYVDPRDGKKAVWVGKTKIGGNYDDRCKKIEDSISSETDTRNSAIQDIKNNAVHNNQYYIRYVPIVGASEREAASTNGCSINRAYFKDGTQITSKDTGNAIPTSSNCPVGTCRGLIFGGEHTYAEVLIPLDGSHNAISEVKDNIEDIAVGILGVHMYNVSFKGILSSFSIKKTKDPETNTAGQFVKLLFISPSAEKMNLIDKGVTKEVSGPEGAGYITMSKRAGDGTIGYKQFKDSFNGSYVEVLFKRSTTAWPN